MRWAAIDFETATRARDSACALGVVVVEDGRELHRQAWLIRPPGNAYESMNIQVHGIHPADTDDAPDFGAVWNEAMDVIGDRPLVAHNAPFDIGVVRACCDGFELEPPDTTYHCTVQLARRSFPGLSAYKLPIVAGHVGAVLQHHDALSDAAACSRIVEACFQSTTAASMVDLYEHHGLKHKRVHAGR